MSTYAPRLTARRAFSAASTQTLLLGACAIAAAVWAASVGLQSRHAFVHDALPVLLAPLALWMFFSDRYEITLAVLLVYLGVLDGVVKLASGWSATTLGRDVLLYAITLGAIASAIVRRKRFTVPPLGGIVLAWIAVCVMQVANPSAISVAHAAAALRQHLEFVPLFFFGYLVLRSERRLTGLLLLLLAVAAANGVANLIESGLSPAQLASWGPGYDHLEFGTASTVARTFVTAAGTAHVRPPGLGGEDGFGGFVGLIALPGAVALLGSARRGLKLGWFVIPATVLTIIGVATSQGRLNVVGSVLALFAFLVLTATSRRGLTALMLTAVIGVSGYLIGSAVESHSANRYSTIAPSKVFGTALTDRKGTLSTIPTYFVRYPLGAGLGSVGPAASSTIGGNVIGRQLNGESEFTFLLVEAGIPGLLVMLTFVLATLRTAIALRRVADPRLQRSLMAVTAVLIGLFAVWFFSPVTSSTPGAPFIWLGGGCFAYWYGEMRAGRVRMRPRRVGRALAQR